MLSCFHPTLEAFMAPTIGNTALCHEAASHISSSFTACSVLFYSRWCGRVIHVFLLVSSEQRRREGLCCLHIRQSVSRIYAFPGRRPWVTRIYTHTVHSEEKLNAASTREGQTSLWILIESGWLSVGSAVGLQYSVFQTVRMCLTHVITMTVWSIGHQVLVANQTLIPSVVGVLWQRFGKSLSEHTCM